LLVPHVFVKKTQTTPRRAIETVLKHLEEST
jgi:phage-related protein